jgi:cold-inducible RNA-binding protein
MGNKLYVGNLSYSMTDDALSQLFAQAGTVLSAKIIMDNMSGRSKGFGFVEMSNEEEAKAAIAKLNGQTFEERALSVAEARPMVPREKRSFGGGGSGRRDRY